MNALNKTFANIINVKASKNDSLLALKNTSDEPVLFELYNNNMISSLNINSDNTVSINVNDVQKISFIDDDIITTNLFITGNSVTVKDSTIYNNLNVSCTAIISDISCTNNLSVLGNATISNIICK